jgi:hypothetical protein
MLDMQSLYNSIILQYIIIQYMYGTCNVCIAPIQIERSRYSASIAHFLELFEQMCVSGFKFKI